MSVVAITGNHPRHYFIIRRLAEAGLLSGWVMEERKAFVPPPPSDCVGRLRELFVLHFDRRAAAEDAFFGEPGDANSFGVPILNVTKESLNDDATHQFIRKLCPRIALSYGCHKITENTLRRSGATFWNIHGGLSSRYRGVATHFWPSYFLEPQYTGVTLHESSPDLDGGGIIHQSAGTMNRGDGLHDLACRTMSEFAAELPLVLKAALNSDVLPRGTAQQSSGKLWLESDWRPEHLRVIYDLYQDRIVDLLLDGELKGREPLLIRGL